MHKFILTLFFIVGAFVASYNIASAGSLIDRVSGYILLQVEEVGQAWYVNPEDGLRYYMRDGDVAYEMMRSFGLGITDFNLAFIPSVTSTSEMENVESICTTNSLANRLKGQILLQVQQLGEAWYIYPEKCYRIYMKDGAAAYETMRFLGLGITNFDLSQIETGFGKVPQTIPPTTPPDETIIITLPEPAPEPVTLADIIEQWESRTAEVGCIFNDGTISLGSGFLLYAFNKVGLLTNNHLTTNIDNYSGIAHIPEVCATIFLDGSEYLFTPLDILVPTINGEKANKWELVNGYYEYVFNEDWAFLEIKNPSTQTLANSQKRWSCTIPPRIGDDIVILGYPSIGAHSGLTATEGIISGIEEDFYITSAKIDHGNSGGLAIHIEQNCYIGIPTSAEIGTVESLGRIIKKEVVFN